MKDIYASRIKGLKTASGFTVTGEKERAKVLKAAQDLQKYGVINFAVVTRETEPNSGKFKVVAI